MKAVFSATLPMLFLLGFGPAALAGEPAAPSAVPVTVDHDRSADYVVGPQDVIEIKVYGEDDLSRTSQVAADGTVDLALLQRVAVTGLTASQIKDKLEQLYGADYLVHPQVFVSVKEFHSQQVQVLGAVKEPGVFRLTGPSAVLDVLGMAGGISDAGGKSLLLLRPTPGASDDARGSVEPINVDVHKLLVEGDTSQNLVVKGGDVVFVPRADEVYVIGEVRNPGSLKFEDGMTLTQAITKMNGFTKTASKKKVQVVRVEGGKKTPIELNVGKIESGKAPDFELQPRDLIVVPETIF